jgi:inward rectifier potassium channel
MTATDVPQRHRDTAHVQRGVAEEPVPEGLQTHSRAYRPPRRRPIVRGQDGTQWKDIYHRVLTAPWWAFFAGLAGFFVGINAIFACFYYFDPAGIANARNGSFWDAFFFSIQTIASLTSAMQPRSDYARVVMSTEAFIGIINVAVVTGVTFARFSRPFARILFSNVAVVAPFDGVPTLMFRAANQRGNPILDASASVSLVRRVTTAEGITMRRFEQLKLERDRSPLFSLSWTVMHRITPDSPLFGVTRADCDDQEMEITVLLSGMDETLSQVIYARHSFLPEDILFDRRFVDVLRPAGEGRMEVNLHRFHDTVPWPPA